MSSFRLSPLLCAAILLFCSACSPSTPSHSAASTESQNQPASFSQVSSEVSGSASSIPDEPSVPVIFVPETPVPPESSSDAALPEASPQPDPAPQPPAAQPPAPEDPLDTSTPTQVPSASYDFSQPVPESTAVDLSYFADAAFVGDSRSEGFYLYGVKRGKNLSSSGLSVFTFAKNKAFTIGGVSYTGLEALALKEYTKVYLGFGVNELGYIDTDVFYQAYCDTIDAVRACQPNAVVYAQTIIPVNEAAVAAVGGKQHLNNERVCLYNDLIRQAALEKHVPLLDLYSALAADGSLPADASQDGIHLNRNYYQKQLDYVQRHTIAFDTLYTTPEPEVPTDETSSVPAAGDSADPDTDSLLPQPEELPLPAESDPAPDAAAG